MPGHNGGVKGRFFLDTAELADDMERRMDALGWDTAHIVGNSLGGWVAFELERRGRARTLTGIAPAGGWRRYTPAKFEIVFKFVAGFPVWLVTQAARRARAAAAVRQTAGLRADQRDTRRASATPTCPTSSTTSRTARPTTSCWSNRCCCPGLHGTGQRQRAHPPGDLREGPGAAAPALHPSLHHASAGVHADHASRGRRAHPDVRGTATGSPSDPRLRRRARDPKRATG